MTCFSPDNGRFLSVLAVSLTLVLLPAQLTAVQIGGEGTPDPVAEPEALEAPEAPEEYTSVDTVIRIDHAGGAIRLDIDKGADDIVRMGESLVIDVDREVDGDAVVISGNMDIHGKVRGDAVVVGGTLHLFPTAFVRGDAVAIGGGVIKDEGAEVVGERVSIGVGGLPALFGVIGAPGGVGSCSLWCTPAGKVIAMLGTLLVTFLMILIFVELFGTPTEKVAGRAQHDYLRAGLAGFLIFILTLPVLIVLAISIVGLLLWPFLFVLMIVVPVWGFVAVSLVLGRTWGAKILPGLGNRWGRALVGAVLLFLPILLGNILVGMGPLKFFGWSLQVAAMVIHFLVFLVGIGAVFMSRFGRRSHGGGGTEPTEAAAPVMTGEERSGDGIDSPPSPPPVE